MSFSPFQAEPVEDLLTKPNVTLVYLITLLNNEKHLIFFTLRIVSDYCLTK